MSTKKILAIDVGAESGRGLVGSFDGERLTLEVVSRFPNGGVSTLNTLHWDVLGLWRDMQATLSKASAEHGALASVGVDTWGVDFALLDKDNALLGNPRHYRDPHTEHIMDQAFAKVPRNDIYRQTGIQFMRFNSLFQLLAMMRDRSPILDVARSLLFIPDLFHFWMTGIKANEYTNASTSQMIDPGTRDWARDLVRAFGIPDKILGTLVQPGTILGPLRPENAGSPVPVIVPATHDTASAVAGVPAQGDSWAYISSGTWSLMGIETKTPKTDENTLRVNFTNEAGFDGTIRLLKNIMGLWLVQGCRRGWGGGRRGGATIEYADLMRMAEASAPFGSIINPDDPSFLLPIDMPKAIAEFCAGFGQAIPREPGEAVRCVLESLALRYRWVLARLEELAGKRLDTIHIVGGGSQNTLLCQLTADACDRVVVAGPVEATAIGNVLVQAIGLGLIGSLAEGREVVRRSFEVRTYEPRCPERWDEPYRRFLGMIG